MREHEAVQAIIQHITAKGYTPPLTVSSGTHFEGLHTLEEIAPQYSILNDLETAVRIYYGFINVDTLPSSTYQPGMPPAIYDSTSTQVYP